MKRTITIALLATLLTACGTGRSPRHEDAPARDTLQHAEPRQVTDGPSEVRYPDGRIKMKGDLKGGKRHGVWTAYFPNGAVQSRNAYEDGVLEGTSIVFHPNGQACYTGDYHHGVQVGEWQYFDENGGSLKVARYDSTGALINDR